MEKNFIYVSGANDITSKKGNKFNIVELVGYGENRFKPGEMTYSKTSFFPAKQLPLSEFSPGDVVTASLEFVGNVDVVLTGLKLHTPGPARKLFEKRA